jgi:hypothetical protein
MQELQYNLSGQFGLASRPRVERIRDLFYFRTVKIRENLKENLETFPVQAISDSVKILAPDQEIP